MSTPVSSILSRKGDWVITIEPNATVFDTISRMVEHNVGAICVVQGGELVGIFTERDYLRRIILQGRASKTTRVEEVMTKDVVCATPDHTADDCMALMTEKRIRHLPVVEQGHVIGVISIGDVVRAAIDDRDFHIQQLENYIATAG